ncbi:DUF1015 family protein [uncultured Akkermansia sp.]|uniref:DUF1015 domain-containing protein n=1 Tax=uncultured Akkermansia sp. TaxID=512294 RepID=UPI002592F291|nr:DUF1015 family protein [uncultured Akkermansia sp.]
MSTLHPFPALRPPRELAARVSSLPYDVMNHREAKEMAAGNDASFLHICRSDIDTGEAAIHAPETYAKARENLERFVREGYLFRDERPSFYIYRQIMWGRVQTGIVGCASVDEYASGAIKKHELTRREKELDRIEHFDACSAQTEPVFLAYRKHEGLSTIIREWIKFHKPEYDFTTEDGVTHILWPVSDPGTVEDIRKSFEEVDALYIADGHHRTASSAAVSARRRQKHPDYTGQEEFNYLMAVVFCDEDLFIMDYNRVVRDLNGLTEEEFMEKLRTAFDVKPAEAIPGEGYAPRAKHEFGMYLNGRWYSVTAKPGTFPAGHPIESLDCAILQANVLAPILGIDDPRTSDRIDFVGGIRGLGELERRCSGEMTLAFSLYPVTMADLFRVADAGEIMPPKSTWFEPKLRSGLFIHTIEQ